MLALGCRRKSESEQFGIGQAMAMLYGNFDASKGTSTTTFKRADSVYTYDEPMAVRSLFQAFVNEDGQKKFVILTYAVPSRDEKYYCHACAPTIGMAVYRKEQERWVLSASKRAVTDSGSFGKPPQSVELVEIGANRHAVKIEETDEGNGETTKVLTLVVPWKNSISVALERIIADDNEGMCDDADKGLLPCYSNQRKILFFPNQKSNYFDIELTLSGTDLLASEKPRLWRARKVKGKEVLSFQYGRYVQVSRSGDLTKLDQAVADRENLK
jgi:hypothetical protein